MNKFFYEAGYEIGTTNEFDNPNDAWNFEFAHDYIFRSQVAMLSPEEQEKQAFAFDRGFFMGRDEKHVHIIDAPIPHATIKKQAKNKDIKTDE